VHPIGEFASEWFRRWWASMSCAAFTGLTIALALWPDQSKVNGLFVRACGVLALIFFVVASYAAWKRQHDLYMAERLANEPDVLLSFRYRWLSYRSHDQNPLTLRSVGRDVATDVTLEDLGVEGATLVALPVSFASIRSGDAEDCLAQVRKSYGGNLPQESIVQLFEFLDRYENLPIVVKVRFKNRLCTSRYVRTFSVHRDGAGGINFTPVSLELVKE
jgi:hypothetical protein